MADQDDPCQEKQSISSDEEAVQKNNNDNGCPYYFLKPTLLSALSLVGAIHKQYTFKEILSLLKAYIFETKAFDPEDEKFVLCSSDLGKAFGVDRFEYSQVRNLISKNLVCASNVPSSSTSDMEEKVEPINGETSSSRYFKIHVPYVPDFQSGPESEYSNQEYDTAVCKDSDCNVDEESEEEEVEYELESEAETDVVKESNSESDVESILFIVGVEDSCNSDEDCFADGSHSSSSSSSSSSDAKDSTDDERDKWPCVNCGIRNKPFMRYCLKCWELRKDWYPDPPKRRRRRKPRPKKGKKRNYLDKRAVQLLDEKATEAEDDTAEEDESVIRLERTSSTASSCTVTSTSSSALTVVSQDSGFGSQDSTTFKLISLGGKRKNAEPDDAAKKRTKNDDGDSVVHNISKKFRKFSDSTEGKRWLKSSNANDLMEKLLLYSSDSETEETIISQENCTLCYARPKNASIIHGRLSHIGFCYPCAKRLYNSKAKCPICRRKIHMITKNSYV